MKRSLLILFVLMLLFSACASAAPTATPALVQVATDAPAQAANPAPQPAEVKVLFQIIKADGTKFDVTLDAVKALPLAQITVDGKVQEGPKLLSILSLAGVTDFNEIIINGSSAPSTLTREQVDANTILDFSNRGTMKLATTYFPKAGWTKDITEITVK